MGMLGGLAAGFLGAGLLGMLFGGGLFSGLGGFASILGLILQVGLIILVVRLAMMWWQRRHTPATAYASRVRPRAPRPDRSRRRTSAAEWALASDRAARRSRSSPPTMKPSSACSATSRPRGRTRTSARCEKLTTPEMASYFAKDLAENKARNDVNKISDVKLLQGDLAEAWREGETDYASVAMRFSLVDKTLERTTGRLVAGSEQPIEATEVWTFARRRGSDWELSAIQQTS